FNSIFEISTAGRVRLSSHPTVFQFGAQPKFQLACGLLSESDCYDLTNPGSTLSEHLHYSTDEFGGLVCTGGGFHNYRCIEGATNSTALFMIHKGFHCRPRSRINSESDF